MEQLLPCARQSHMTVRGRLARVADEMERKTLRPSKGLPPTAKQESNVSVFLDGAHIRCRPEYQKRHLDVVVGRIESTGRIRRFAFEPSSSMSPRALIRAQLQSGGWQPGRSLQDLSRPSVGSAVRRIRKRCEFLATYLDNNAGSIPDYGKRFRKGLPVSTSRAEGCVDDLANLRMGKRRRMRWSPKGAHRVAITRAAVLDGRLCLSHRQNAA